VPLLQKDERPLLVPKLHLGTGLFAQLCCCLSGFPSKIGNGVASASAFPNGVWERGKVKHSFADKRVPKYNLGTRQKK
jgi:hypothetical protein